MSASLQGFQPKTFRNYVLQVSQRARLDITLAVGGLEQAIDVTAEAPLLQTQTGGFTIRIRGVSTFVGNTEPLYVVDGVPVQVAPGRGIDWLNTGDIARIDVLKDAASTSAYGMRGANGVVLITTKRGR